MSTRVYEAAPQTLAVRLDGNAIAQETGQRRVIRNPKWPALSLAMGLGHWRAGGYSALHNFRDLPFDEIILSSYVSWGPRNELFEPLEQLMAGLAQARGLGLQGTAWLGNIVNNLDTQHFIVKGRWDPQRGTVTLPPTAYTNFRSLNPDDPVVTFEAVRRCIHTCRVEVVDLNTVKLAAPLPLTTAADDVNVRFAKDLWYYCGHGQSHWNWTNRRRWTAFAGYCAALYQRHGYTGQLHVDLEPNMVHDAEGKHVGGGIPYPRHLWPLIADAAEAWLAWLRTTYQRPLYIWPAYINGNHAAGLVRDLGGVTTYNVDEHMYWVPQVPERIDELTARAARSAAAGYPYVPAFYPEILQLKSQPLLVRARELGAERAIIYVDGGRDDAYVSKLFSAEWFTG